MSLRVYHYSPHACTCVDAHRIEKDTREIDKDALITEKFVKLDCIVLIYRPSDWKMCSKIEGGHQLCTRCPLIHAMEYFYTTMVKGVKDAGRRRSNENVRRHIPHENGDH